MTHPLLSRYIAIVGAVVIFGLPSALAAQPPTPQELMHTTIAGSYLAARHAGTERDSATAAAYISTCSRPIRAMPISLAVLFSRS